MGESVSNDSRASHLRYLPMAYFLPRELLSKCPTLSKLPRNLFALSASQSSLTLLRSDNYLEEIMDASAALAFPHFGFPGWKEHYTGHFPVWKLSYALPLWAKGIEREIGWGLQMLFSFPKDTAIPLFNSDYVNAVFELVVKRTIMEQGWQPLLDLLREMPCDEDFEPWHTNVRMGFLRKWYHTRSKKVQSISLEAILEEGYGRLSFLPDAGQDVEEKVISQDYVERFLDTLSVKDAEILQRRMDGFTHDKIANELGYANHSGVIKRMQHIKKAFQNYQQAQQDTLTCESEANRSPGS